MVRGPFLLRVSVVSVASIAAGLMLAVPASAATTTKSDTSFSQVDNGSVEKTINFSAADLGSEAGVDSVTVALDFAKIDDTNGAHSCGPPPVDGFTNEFNDEIRYQLVSPSGTTIMLIDVASYTPDAYGGRVTVTLDDSASAGVSGVPTTGTFKPAEPLSTLAGEDATGDWKVRVVDAAPGDPICHYGASITLNTSAIPSAADDSYSTVEGEALSVPAAGVLANDSDGDGDSLTAAADPAGAAHGTVALAADGSFTYTPDASFTGTDSFEYTAEDPGGHTSAPAEVSIEVAAPPLDPGLVDPVLDIAFPQFMTGGQVEIEVTAGAGELVTARVGGKIFVGKGNAVAATTTNVDPGQRATLLIRPKTAQANRRIMRALEKGRRVTATLNGKLSDTDRHEFKKVLETSLVLGKTK